MKVIIILTVVAFAAASPSIMEEWNAFKMKYGKSYESIEEEQRRMAIFSEKLKMIKDNNAKYDAGLSSHTSAINQFADKRREEMACLRPRGKEDVSKLPRFTYVPPANVELPNSVNWTEKGAVTSVKDQMFCQTCWAFSTTGAMEGQLFKKTNKLVSLSEQQLMDCSRSYGNNGCMGGGLMDDAFKYLEDVEGLESEDTYPYEDKEDKCRYNAAKVVTGTKVKGYTDIKKGDDEALKSAVATIGPISIGMSTGEEFHNYKGGIFKIDHCDTLDIDHGVLLVGYGTDNGDDFWLIKNSWGIEEWGENGYMRLSRARKNPCKIASAASYPILE